MIKLKKQPPLIEAVVKFVCEEYDSRPETLFGESRLWMCVEPRHAAWYLLREVFKLEYKQIAKAFDRHPKTILSGCRNFDKRLKRGKATLPESAREFINRHQKEIVEAVRKEAQVAERLKKLSLEHAQKLNARIDKLGKEKQTELIFGVENLIEELEGRE